MININFNEMRSILNNEAEGQEILIITDMNQFTFKSFGTLEQVEMYTDRIKLTLDNSSTFELNEDDIKTIQFVNEPSRNNTKLIEILLTGAQLIVIEFQAI